MELALRSIDSCTARYAATRIGSDINATQKEIGQKKKVCSNRACCETLLITFVGQGRCHRVASSEGVAGERKEEHGGFGRRERSSSTQTLEASGELCP